MPVPHGRERLLLYAAALLGEFHLHAFQFFLGFRDVAGVNIAGQGFVPLVQGVFPMIGGELEAPGLVIEIAEMVLNSGVVA